MDLLTLNSATSLRHDQMRAAIRGLLLGASQDARLHGRRGSARLAPPMPALQTGHAVLFKAALPFRDRRRTRSKLAFDVAITESIGKRENQAGSKHVTGGRGP